MSKIKRILILLKRHIKSDYISTDENDLLRHARDKSFHKGVKPDIVIWPTSTKDVSNILKIANKEKIPVTAWGGGSSLEGNPIPTSHGIILDMTKMNAILDIAKEDLEVRVQPGIVGEELDRQLQPYSLWFAAAPGSKHIATIGGMIANNAGGMHAIRYGVVGDAVLKLQVVLANGKVIEVGSKSFKSVSGYDIKRLFIGSEGTLGIITEAVLKLSPLPDKKVALLVSFQTNAHAADTSLKLLQTDIKPASIEFMDRTYITLVNKATKATLREEPTLLIELHGNRKTILQQLFEIQKICLEHTVTTVSKFTTEKKLKELWGYRRAVRPIVATLFPQTGILSAEIGVPISYVSSLLSKATDLAKMYEVKTIMFGHMGDGNFHGWALYTLGNVASWKKVSKFNNALIRYAISIGGTTTGEHGIGIGKRKFLKIEHKSSIHLMKHIKLIFDPNNILNPGKIFF